MRDRNKQTDGQLSMLDGLLKAIDNGTVTAQDIIDMIHRLRDSYEEVKNREAEEKRKREEAEAKRRELLREEARQRHIEKVTSMDLPLTWENAFAAAVASPVPAFAPGACVAVSGVLAQDASSSADSRNTVTILILFICLFSFLRSGAIGIFARRPVILPHYSTSFQKAPSAFRVFRRRSGAPVCAPAYGNRPGKSPAGPNVRGDGTDYPSPSADGPFVSGTAS